MSSPASAPGTAVRSRIAVATADTLKPQMAGPAIRAWQIAAALAAEGHDVRLVTTSECHVTSPDFDVRQVVTEPAARELEAWCDVLFFQGNVLDGYPFLQRTEKVVIVDLYDPFHLEQLEQTKEHPPETRRLVVGNAVAEANKQCLRGDFLVCASEKQRDFWLGHLAALGRLNTVSYDADVTLRSLLDIAPFGISPEPPQRSRPALKGVVPGIGPDDEVILWGGGIYNWFDPLTLISAVDLLKDRRPQVRLFFLGMQHPHPHVPEMRMSFAARELATERGLTGKHVFFNEEWVRYDDRANYLLDADIGVSNHLDHVETAFSFRTRMLDYLWAGLPMVCTTGDVFAALVDARGLGVTVAPGDVEGLADALEKVLADGEFAAQCRANVREVAPEYHWDRVLAPLVEFCRNPVRAPDLLDDYARRRMAQGAARLYRPKTGVRRELEILGDHLRDGGVPLVAAKARSRVGYLTGRKKPPPRARLTWPASTTPRGCCPRWTRSRGCRRSHSPRSGWSARRWCWPARSSPGWCCSAPPRSPGCSSCCGAPDGRGPGGRRAAPPRSACWRCCSPSSAPSGTPRGATSTCSSTATRPSTPSPGSCSPRPATCGSRPAPSTCTATSSR